MKKALRMLAHPAGRSTAGAVKTHKYIITARRKGKDMKEEKLSVCDLSAELIGISRIITGLSNQLEAKKTDNLTVESLQDALFGVSRHLDRIADDLISME